jgi:integrase/recombinase XerD
VTSVNTLLPFQPDAMAPAQLAAVSYLARYSGHTHMLYASHLRRWFAWCQSNTLDPLVGIQRAHIELYIRHLGQAGLMASSVVTSMHAVRGYFRYAHIDGLIVSDPAVYARLPKVHRDEYRTQGLDRLELIRFLQVAQTLTVHHGALAFLLGINAQRASEAAAVRIEDYAETLRGHRVLHLVGKGDKPATMPVTVPVLRVLEACRGSRTEGRLILRPVSGNPIDRRDAYRMVARIAKAAGITRHISPHSLRHAAITNALDAGVPLRDAQILARHADPRTTEHYDALKALALAAPAAYADLLVKHAQQVDRRSRVDFDTWEESTQQLSAELRREVWRRVMGTPRARELFWVLAGNDPAWVEQAVGDVHFPFTADALASAMRYQINPRFSLETLAIALRPLGWEPDDIVWTLDVGTLSGEDHERYARHLETSRALAASDEPDVARLGARGVAVYEVRLAEALEEARQAAVRGGLYPPPSPPVLKLAVVVSRTTASDEEFCGSAN